MTDTPDIEQQIDNVPLLKPIKEKKPRSEKQLKSFAACAERLKERHRVQLHDKKVKAAKFLLDHDIKPTIPEPIKVKEEPIIVKEESSDEEVIYLKREKVKTSKKKPKVKTIILSSSESESESEEERIQPIPEKKFISQQNKKSLIKVHKQEPINKSYFAD
jgi:hypothetical protein